MNNNTNIYDIDGDLIRAAGDYHKFTIEEAQEKIKQYIEKLKSLDKTDKDYALKVSTYNQYVDNLANYIIRERALRGDFEQKPAPTSETTNTPSVQVIDENGEQVEVVEE